MQNSSHPGQRLVVAARFPMWRADMFDYLRFARDPLGIVYSISGGQVRASPGIL